MTNLFIVHPLLVAAHPVAPDQVDRPERIGRVQTVVVGHDLVALGVRKHLVAAETVAVAAADLLVRLAAHRVQAVLGLLVADLKKNKNE